MLNHVGRYQIRQVLGRGTAGTVYAGVDPELGRDVAIKVLNATATPEIALERFRREARIVASLAHPNIVTIFDVGMHDGSPFLVMEFVRGATVAQMIASQVPLALNEKLRIAEQVCLALEAAHAAGVVHRDVKPANICVTTEGSARLLDFGVAHVTGSVLTHPAELVGTPAYFPPELIHGRPLDGCSDVYSLTATLYEWTTGRRPHAADSFERLLWLIVHQDVPEARTVWPACPTPLSAILSKGLARSPADRYPTAGAFRTALIAAKQSVGTGQGDAVFPDLVATLPPPGAPMMRADPSAITVPPPGYGIQRGRARDRRWLLYTLTAGAAGVLLLVAQATTLRTRDEPRSVAGGTDVRLPAPAAALASPPRDKLTASPSKPESTAPGVPDPVAARLEQPSNAAEPAPPPPLRIPIGTVLLVTITSELRSDRTSVGDRFDALLADALLLENKVVVPAGTPVRGRIASVARGDPNPSMELSLTELGTTPNALPLRTARYRVTAPDARGAGAGPLIIGAAAGAMIGGALGGSKGAAVGAAAAAGMGLGTDGGHPSWRYVLGDHLTFKLAEPVFLSAEWLKKE